MKIMNNKFTKGDLIICTNCIKPVSILNIITSSMTVTLTRLVGCGKKVKFCRIFRDKFTEKNSLFRWNFWGILEASFAKKRWVKNG